MEPMDYLERFIHRVSGVQATVDTPRCLREHSGLSDCHLCVKSCPVESIDLGGGVHVLSHCTGCGICLTVCPVSAFDLSGARAGQLLSQLASLLRESQDLLVSCERSADAGSADLIVPCLARMDETLLVGALALGARKLYLTRGPCQDCPYPEAIPRYRRMLARVRTWDRVLPGSSERIVEVGEGEEAREKQKRSRARGPDRRAFFTWVRSEGVQLMASFFDDFSQGFQGKGSMGGRSLPLRNQLLPQFLKKLKVRQGEVPHDPEGPFADLLLDEVKCNACEACFQICPTRAIQREGGEEAFRLTLDASRCVNCSLCLDACVPNALTYRQGLSLYVVASGEPQVLVENAYRSCVRCEVRFLSNAESASQDLCSACHYLDGLESSGAIPYEGSEE
ncbi:MAG: 4Fe-4S binding protein [Candidatus Methylomirabilales bacterium]